MARSTFYLLYALSLLTAGCMQSTQGEFNRLQSSKDWKLAFSDPCTGDWQDQWFLDGEMATIENSAAGMQFSAGPVDREDAHHAVLWTKDSFAGDVKIEYDYTRTDSQRINVNILFIHFNLSINLLVVLIMLPFGSTIKRLTKIL